MEDVLEVQCAGCGDTLEVERGMTEFACPGCAMPQALPPELMPPPPPRPRRALPLGSARGPGPSTPPSTRVPCDGCGAVLAVPRGIRRAACPLCGEELYVDRLAAHNVVQVVSQPRAVSVAATSSRLREEEPIGQPSLLGQVGRYNKPVHLNQMGGSFPAYSLREEPSSSHRSNARTAIPVDWVKRAHTSQSVHIEESHINLHNETVDGNDLRKQYRPSASHRSGSINKVGIEHPTKVSHAPQAQDVSSNQLVHTEEVYGENQSGTIGRARIQRARYAAISSIPEQEGENQSGTSGRVGIQKVTHAAISSVQEQEGENQSGTIGRVGIQNARHTPISSIPVQETVEPSGQIACPEQVEVDSCNDRTGWNRKRKRSSKTATGNHTATNEEIHLACSNHTQPETRIRNPIQQPPSASDENPFDLADIDRIVDRLCPSSLPQKQVSQARSKALENIDATLPVIPIDHGTPQGDCYSTDYMQYRAGVTGSAVHQPLLEHQLSDTIHSRAYITKSSKKRRGRGPTKLIEPRREAYRPVLTPNSAGTWDIDPLCFKVASTISVLLKQWHPGSTFMLANQQTNEVHQEQLILRWKHYPPDSKAAILDEFLQRYKWAPGQEAVCMKMFQRKVARQFNSLLCDEKRRVKIAFERKAKVALDAANASSKQINLDGDTQDPATTRNENEDPLRWKPFPPEWMQPKWWEMLCEHWASEEVLRVSAQQRKNRYTGGFAGHTGGSRSIAMHRKLMIMKNGGKPVSDIEVFNRTHKRDAGKGEFVSGKAKEIVERFKCRLEEAGDTDVDPHLVWVEVGGRDRGRFYGLNGIIDKARIKAMAKATGCVDKRTHKEMFTQDQVQEMISQAMQQLNESWEKRFQSLEQKMAPEAPEHVPSPCAVIPAAEGLASHQDASGSSKEGSYQSATDDEDDNDEDYVG